MHFDTVVIGGGVIGASIAYFLRRHARAGSVGVIERDPSYSLASTPRASGGVRRLFSLPENIAMSDWSIGFFERFEEEMSVDGEPARIGFKKNGYLFIVPPGGVQTLAANFDLQRAHGVDVIWLDPPALQARFPFMNTDDLGAGVYSPGDGWLDPHGVLWGFRRKARALGAEFIADEAVAIETAEGLARTVVLKSGSRIRAGAIVNAAGAWAKEICAMVGMRIPIEPMRRYEHYFECAEPIEPLPYVKDLDRLAFRPEGRGYSGGVPNLAEPRGFNFDVDHDYFDSVVWPALAQRFRPFERTKVKTTLPGLYDQNEFDASPIIGPWERLPNFYLCAGFSGHGLMHAPACGRAMSELLLEGGYRTIDLLPFGFRRVTEGKPYAERGII